MHRTTYFIIPSFIFCQCFVFSSYQSSRLLRPDQFAVGPSATIMQGFPPFENIDNPIKQYGAFVTFGCTDNFNLRLRYEYLAINQKPVPDFKNNGDLSYVEIEPKFRLHKDNIAFSLPIGIYSTPMVQLMPAFIFSHFFTSSVSMSLSPRVILMGIEYSGLAIDCGMSIGIFNNSVIVYPEVGIYALTLTQCYLSSGIAISFGN
jgi:hypothetical protein